MVLADGTALDGLGALDGGHEGVGDGGRRGVVGGAGGRGGKPVEGGGEAELEGAELEAVGEGGRAGAGAGVAEHRRRGSTGEQGRDGVERGGLGVSALPRRPHSVVEGAGCLRREALPRRAHRRRHQQAGSELQFRDIRERGFRIYILIKKTGEGVWLFIEV